MPALDGTLFTGAGAEISETDIQNCEASNSGDAVSDILTDYGWDGSPTGGILLHLSPDNIRIAAGSFFTRGAEEKEYVISAGKLWAEADMNVTITIRLPAMDSFIFTDGGLTSDFLPGEEVVYYLHENREGAAPRPILSNDLAKWGIGKFCLRLVCHLAKSSSVKNGIRVKYNVMAYPASIGALRLMSEHVSNASWPGIKLGDGELQLLPTPTTPWGCPLLPILRPGVPFETEPRAPSATVLRHAIAAIIGRSGAPDAARSAASLAAKWERLKTNTGDFSPKPAPVTWPTAATPPPDTGKHNNKHTTRTQTHTFTHGWTTVGDKFETHGLENLNTNGYTKRWDRNYHMKLGKILTQRLDNLNTNGVHNPRLDNLHTNTSKQKI